MLGVDAEFSYILPLQARSAAVDKLYSALQRVQDKDVLLPTLSKLLRFLSILGEDANFKISLSTLQILADLALKLRADIRPYLGYVPVNLHCKALLFSRLSLTVLCIFEALVIIMVAGNIHQTCISLFHRQSDCCACYQGTVLDAYVLCIISIRHQNALKHTHQPQSTGTCAVQGNLWKAFSAATDSTASYTAVRNKNTACQQCAAFCQLHTFPCFCKCQPKFQC